MWNKFLRGLKRFTESTWALPMGAAGALLLAMVLEITVAILAGWGHDEFATLLSAFSVSLLVLFLLGVLGGLLVGLWLPIMTVWWWRRGELKRVLRSWLWSGVAAVIAVLVGNRILLNTFGAGGDYFTVGVTIPEDKEFVLPRGMTFFIDGDVPAQVEKLIDRHPGLPGPVEVNDETVLTALNLAKLSQVAPDLLQEYLLRCLYAEATCPEFSSAVLNYQVFPAHAGDVQTHIYTTSTPTGRTDELVPLQNGWSVKLYRSWRNDDTEWKPQLYAAHVQAVDAELAPLAQNPTREQLDSMLPPVPPRPYLGLWEDTAGIYDMFIVIPQDYAEGSFELRAYEYSCNKKIQFRNNWLPETKVGNTCRVIRSQGRNIVFSGDLGEYYGSVWEIWFTPAEGGEPRRVNSQLFLMAGWQR